MSLVKAQIIILCEESEIGNVNVMFNPVEYTITTDAEVTEEKGLNAKTGKTFQNTGLLTETFSSKLVIDTYGIVGKAPISVRNYVNMLEKAMQNSDPKKPIPSCKFVWGEFTFEGVLTTLSTKYVMFSEGGIPLRANLDIKIERCYKLLDEAIQTNSTFEITIDGAKIDDNEILIDGLKVDKSIGKADSFDFKVTNSYNYEENKFKWIDEFFSPAKPIIIKMGYDDKMKKVFEGFIISVSFEYDDKGKALVSVSGMDESIKLMKGTKTASWDNMSYSDVVKSIAQKNKLDSEVDDSTVPYSKIEQYRKSDYSFIKELADKCGFDFFIHDKKLYFIKPKSNKNEFVEVDLRNECIDFRIEHNIGEQVDTMVFKGNQQKSKESLESKVHDVDKIGSGKSGPELVRMIFNGTVTTNYYYTSETNKDALNKMAQGSLNETAMKLVKGICHCVGKPDIEAGKYIKLKGAGPNLDRLYYVTKAEHKNNENGYITEIEFGGNDI